MNAEKTKGTTPSKSTDCPPPLILDLIGPFVVHFCKNVARIHAPLCANHHANILTDSNDISLSGLTEAESSTRSAKGWVYAFEDGHSPTPASAYSYQNQNEILISPCLMNQIHQKECHLVLELPYPNTVVGLHSEMIWVHKNDASMWVNENQPDTVYGHRSRSLRFIYSECPNPPKFKICEMPAGSTEQPPKLDEFNAESLGVDPPRYNITVRFASNAATSDEHHEDAYNCFQTMRDTVLKADPERADAIKWRVDFDDRVTPGAAGKPFIREVVENVSGKHPVDCGAAVLVVEEPKK